MSDSQGPRRPASMIPQGPRQDELRNPPSADVSSTIRSRRINTRSDWFWPTVNLAGLVLVVGVNVLANVIPFNGQTTAEVITGDPVYFQPADWTFTIWGLIYLLLFGFVGYTLLPAGRRNRRVRAVAPAFLIANIANALWLVLWHYEQWSASVIVMAILGIALIVIYAGLRRRDPSDPFTAVERFMVWTPFSIYLGWITVAFIANVTVAMDRTNSELWSIGPRWWAVLMLGMVLLVTTAMTFVRHDPAYALVITWSTLGIAVEQWDRSRLVSFAAILSLLIAAALTVVASLMAYERRLLGHVLPQAIPARMKRSRERRSEPAESREDGNRPDGASRT